MGGHAHADLAGEHADDRPDRLQWREKAGESVIALGELERLFPRPDPGGDAVQFIIEDIAEALGIDEREMKSLYFGAFFAPRMEQAASRQLSKS